MIDNNMKIGYIFRLFLLLTIMAVFFSCEKDDKFHFIQEEADGGALLPMSNMDVHPLGDSFKVLYTAADSWTVNLSDNSGWIRIKDAQGNKLEKGEAGSTVISIELTPNLQEDRSCKVSFLSNGTKDEFQITQEKAVLQVTAYEDSLNFDWRMSTLVLDVKSNIEWQVNFIDNTNSFSYEVEMDNDDRLVGDKDIRVSTINPNFGDEDKEAIINLTPIKRDYNGNVVVNPVDLSESITLTQDFLYFRVNGTNEVPELSVYSHLGKEYVSTDERFSEQVTSQTIRVECEEEWDFDDTAFSDLWGLEVQKDFVSEYYYNEIGRYVHVHDLKIDVLKPNPEEISRTDTLLLLLNNSIAGAERMIPVVQEPYVFDITTGKEVALANNPMVGNGFQLIHMETVGPWELAAESDHSSWMELLYEDVAVPFGSKVSGVGPVDVAVKVDEQNLSFEDLDVNLLFNTGIHENKEVADTAKVIQNRFRFELTDKAEDIGEPWSRMDMKAHEATLVSDGPWTLELQDPMGATAEEWLDVRAVSATDASIVLDIENHTITGDAGEWILSMNANCTNNGADNRNKSIHMTSDIHSQMGGVLPDNALLNIDVTQEKYRFDIMKDSGSIVNTTIQRAAYSKEEGQVYEFKMECGAPWKIDEDLDWVHFDTSDDVTGEYKTIRMTVDHNVDDGWQDIRSGQIIVRSYDGPDFSGNILEEKRFTISQDRFVFELSDDISTFNFVALPSSAQTFEIKTLDDAGWELVNLKGWEGIIGATGTGTSTISMNPGHYGVPTSRSNTFLVRSTVLNKSPEYSVKVVQEGYKFQFDGETSSEAKLVTFDEILSNNTPQTKKIVCSGQWTISDIPTWLEVKSDGTEISNGSPYKGNATLTFQPRSTNTALEADNTRKNNEITLSSSVSGYAPITLSVTVSQDPYIFSVEPEYDAPADAIIHSRGKAIIKCSGEWTAGPSGLATVEQSEGDKDAELYFNLEPNYQTESQKGTITITSKDHKDGDKLQKTLEYTRPAYEFSIDEFKDKTVKADGEIITFSNLKCTGELMAKVSAIAGSDSDWLTIEQEPTNGVLKIKAESNSGKDAVKRSARVKLYSEHESKNSNLARTITITQEPLTSK